MSARVRTVRDGHFLLTDGNMIFLITTCDNKTHVSWIFVKCGCGVCYGIECDVLSIYPRYAALTPVHGCSDYPDTGQTGAAAARRDQGCGWAGNNEK